MGFDLIRDNGETMQWTNVYWHHMLQIARIYGWDAPGTAPPTGVPACDWNGSYETNDNQLVTHEDAIAWAAALQLAAMAPNLAEISNLICEESARVAAETLKEIMPDLTYTGTGKASSLARTFNRILKRWRAEPPPDLYEVKVSYFSIPELIGALKELREFVKEGAFHIR